MKELLKSAAVTWIGLSAGIFLRELFSSTLDWNYLEDNVVNIFLTLLVFCLIYAPKIDRR